MTDECSIQQWKPGHDPFAAGSGHGTAGFGRRAWRAIKRSLGIDPAYAQPAGSTLRGLAAGAITLALWSTVLALATPSQLQAAALDTGPACTSTFVLA